MNAKKIIALLLVAVMAVFALASCGGNGGNGGTGGNGGNGGNTPATAESVIAAAESALTTAPYKITMSIDMESDNEEYNTQMSAMLSQISIPISFDGDNFSITMTIQGETMLTAAIDGTVYYSIPGSKLSFEATEEQLADLAGQMDISGDIGIADFETLTLTEENGKQIVTATNMKADSKSKIDEALGGITGTGSLGVEFTDISYVATTSGGKYETAVVSFGFAIPVSAEQTVNVEASINCAFTYDGVTVAAPADAAEYKSVSYDLVFGETMTHEEYLAAGVDQKVIVSGTVHAKQSWWDNKAIIYLEDYDGAYLLYNLPCTEAEYNELVPGTYIKVVGYTSEYKGLYEIIDAEFMIQGEGYVSDFMAHEFTEEFNTLTDDELKAYQAMTIHFDNATVVAKVDDAGNEHAFFYGWNGAGSEGGDIYFDVQIGDRVVTMVIESYLTADGTEVYEAAQALKVGDVIDISGYLYWYDGPQPHVVVIAK